MRIIHILFGLLPVLLVSCSGNTSTDAGSAPKVFSAEVQIRDLSNVREVSGPVRAYRAVDISSQISGLITQLPYEEGDRVTKGTVLARLDTRRQEAQLAKARSSLWEAENIYERSEQLHKIEAISREQLEQAQRALVSAQNDVKYLQTELDFGEIRAPMDAVIVTKWLEAGAHVSENQLVYTLEDHNMLVVRAGVSEMDVVYLEVGDTVDMKIDVFAEELISASIRRIFPSADAASRLFTVELVIHQDEVQNTIRPGYLARVFFVLDEKSRVLTIPNESLLSGEKEYFVFVIDEEQRLEKRKVEKGVERDGQIEIISGLKAGETVAAGNLNVLEEGIKVSMSGKFRRYGFRE